MDNIALYLEFARERLKSQEVLNSEYDGKVGGTITLGTALVSVAVVLVNLSGIPLSSDPRLLGSMVILVLSFATIVLIGITSRKLSEWHSGPLEKRFAEYVHTLDSTILRHWVVDSYSEALRNNDATLSRKARWLPLLSYGLYVEVGALIAVGAICCWS